MENRVLPVILVLVLFGFTVCSGCSGEPGNNIFTGEDAADVIEMEKAEKFTVELVENPSTGYSWHWTVNPEGVIVPGSDEFIAAENEDMVGAPGMHEFIFRAEEAGKAEVVFQYYRDWEPENIAETHIFEIVVE